MASIILFVEGETDKLILTNILRAAKYPVQNITFEVAHGKASAIKFAHTCIANNTENATIGVFVDADTMYIQDTAKQKQQIGKDTNLEVFFAVPTIESWIFADDNLVRKNILPKYRLDAERLPFSEEIPYPKELFNRWLKKQDAYNLADEYAFLLDMDIARAAARCPSLHYFLQRMGRLLEVPTTIDVIGGQVGMLPSRIFINLLKEVTSQQTVMFRTLDGHEVTAEALRKEISDDTHIGKEYIGRVLRVARDIIKQTAKSKA